MSGPFVAGMFVGGYVVAIIVFIAFLVDAHARHDNRCGKCGR